MVSANAVRQNASLASHPAIAPHALATTQSSTESAQLTRAIARPSPTAYYASTALALNATVPPYFFIIPPQQPLNASPPVPTDTLLESSPVCPAVLPV
jgi:hypothetical protein